MNILRQLRSEHGLTQKQIAEILNVSRSMVTKYETGVNEMNYETLKRLADYFHVSVDSLVSDAEYRPSTHIPVLGQVRAGIPIGEEEDIIGWETIPERMAASGDYFGLMIKGDSMEPLLQNKDIVIVKKNPSPNNNSIVIALIGDEYTVKQLSISDNGIALIPRNASYQPMFFSKEDIKKLPVTIIGQVVEVRRSIV